MNKVLFCALGRGKFYGPAHTIYFSTVADGWTLQLTMPGLVGGTFDVGTDASPKVSVLVSSRSWTAEGVETTISRTVYGKAMLRKPYPDHLTRDEAQDAANVIENIVLNDYIYADDVIQNIEIQAGFFTDNGAGGSGLANATETLSGVTNNSTEAYWLPISAWINHDLEHVKSTSHAVSLAVAHKHFQSGLPVRAVKFIATDTSLNSMSVTVSSMTKLSWTASGLSAPVFQGVLDFTGLTQGQMVTIDAIVYPWVGDAFQVSTSGDAYPSSNLTVLKCLNDKIGTYGTAYAYVNAVGGGTPQVSTNPVTAAANPYSTVPLAAAAIQTFNLANFTRNEVSGGVIRLAATTHLHGTFSARAIGLIPLVIESANIADKLTTIYQDGGLDTQPGITTKVLYRNLTIKRNANVSIFDTRAVGPSNIIIFDNCDFAQTAGTYTAPFANKVGRMVLIECGGEGIGIGSPGSGTKETVAIGCNITRVIASARKFIGNRDSNASWVGTTIGSSDNTYPEGVFIGWNFLSQGLNYDMLNWGSTQTIGLRGGVFCCNVVEKWGLDTWIPMWVSTNSTAEVHNFQEYMNTCIGARTNLLYNDSAIAGYSLKKGISSNSIHETCNIKTDIFAGSGLCTGNWSTVFRIGSVRHALRSTGSFYEPQYMSVGDIHGVTSDFINDQSTYGGNTGNGDYTPGPNTALPQIPAGETAYPWDLLGRVIPTDGTAYVGAVQRA